MTAPPAVDRGGPLASEEPHSSPAAAAAPAPTPADTGAVAAQTHHHHQQQSAVAVAAAAAPAAHNSQSQQDLAHPPPPPPPPHDLDADSANGADNADADADAGPAHHGALQSVTHLEPDSGSDTDSAFDANSSASTSLASSILNYEYSNGRRYHGYRSGAYPLPNDEQEQDQ